MRGLFQCWAYRQVSIVEKKVGYWQGRQIADGQMGAGDGPRIHLEGREKRRLPVPPREQATYFMAQVRQGDTQAFEQLQQCYTSHLTAFLRKRHRNFADIEDMAQEVFLRVWNKREQYRPGTPDWPYLKGFAGIVMKEYRVKVRSDQKIQSDISLEFVIESPRVSLHEQAAIKEQAKTLLVFVHRLPKKQRQALDLTYFIGMTSKEASEKLGCSEKTIQNNRRLGLMKLRAWMRAKE